LRAVTRVGIRSLSNAERFIMLCALRHARNNARRKHSRAIVDYIKRTTNFNAFSYYRVIITQSQYETIGGELVARVFAGDSTVELT
jgi:hypothetical protein